MTIVIYLLKILHCKICEKKVTAFVVRNVTFCFTKYVLVRKARGDSFVVDNTDQKCTTNWWDCTYGGTFSINCKQICNFLNNYNIKHFHIKNLTCYWRCAENDSALTFCLVHVRILHIKPRFVRDDRNCTTPTYFFFHTFSFRITYFLFYWFRCLLSLNLRLWAKFFVLAVLIIRLYSYAVSFWKCPAIKKWSHVISSKVDT